VNSTCKKIIHHPIDMYGFWAGETLNDCFCSKVYIIIPKSGKHGVYGGWTNADGCTNSWKGTVRYNDKHLYIGKTKFEFVSKPINVVKGDSAYNFANQKLPVIAEMVLLTSKLHGSNTYKFKKIEQY